MVKLLYFAWVRERIGKSEEEIVLPDNVSTVGDLLNHLKERGEEYRNALEHSDVIRVALDHHHSQHDAAIGGASEIALFPPMTGG